MERTGRFRAHHGVGACQPASDRCPRGIRIDVREDQRLLAGEGGRGRGHERLHVRPGVAALYAGQRDCRLVTHGLVGVVQHLDQERRRPGVAGEAQRFAPRGPEDGVAGGHGRPGGRLAALVTVPGQRDDGSPLEPRVGRGVVDEVLERSGVEPLDLLPGQDPVGGEGLGGGEEGYKREKKNR